jgi:hypothetical protein
MGIDYSAVSVARKCLAGVLQKDGETAKRFDEIKHLLCQE